jgi:hypothetical protein
MMSDKIKPHHLGRKAILYPVPVRRPAVSLPASFTPASRNDALRFASLAMTSSREDSHLQVDAHAGRTKQKDPLAAVSPKSD